MRCRQPLIVCSLFLAAIAVVTASQSGPFKVGVNLVPLDISVTDSRGRFVRDLEASDFTVLEDGTPQQVSFFNAGVVPLAIALLIDTSPSMVPLRERVQEAAISFVRSLGPQDVVAVIDFDTEVNLHQPFTSNRAAIERAIRHARTGDWTVLYDGVPRALSKLWQPFTTEGDDVPRRRAMIVISDGQDTASYASFDEMLREAARSATQVYPIGLIQSDAPETVKTRNAVFELGRLARQTGGRAFFPRGTRQLSGIHETIKSELANQYLVGYESSNPARDGQFRRVSVRVDRARVSVRTRAGYYAVSE